MSKIQSNNQGQIIESNHTQNRPIYVLIESIYPWISTQILHTLIQILHMIILVLSYLSCTCTWLANLTYKEWREDYGLSSVILSMESCLPWPFRTGLLSSNDSFIWLHSIHLVHHIPNLTRNLAKFLRICGGREYIPIIIF